MSADNTIVVGRFLTKNDSPYYKVCHCQAVENCDYSNNYPKNLIDWYRVVYFYDAPTFYDKQISLEFAFSIEKDFEDEGHFVEYGVAEIDYNTVLLDITAEEAQKKINEWWDAYLLAKK
uniref:Uncharacterized protein n=1 Tax=viral metagenome TaxID=1070528 RepID=A0A6M3KU23_9ZZZZ